MASLFASSVIAQDICHQTALDARDRNQHPSAETRNFIVNKEIDSTAPRSVLGRLKASYTFWKNVLNASDFVLEIIEHGYTIPFVEYPTPCYLKNNASSRVHELFVRTEIEDLLSKGYVTELDQRPYCCNPLTVAKGRKLRLILDCRHINSFVKYYPVKYENWDLLEQVLQADDYFINFDLTAGYHHISILPEHRQFLGFAYEWGNRTRFFVFNQLAFGLCSACYILTKINRPFMKLWRSMGIRSFVYIDDFIGVFRSVEEADMMAPQMGSHMEQAGFMINEEKSNWVPSKSLSWLGFSFNSSSMRIYVDNPKIENALKLCETISMKKTVSPRQVAAVVGKIISMQRALGPEARLVTRHLTFWVQDNLQCQVAYMNDFNGSQANSNYLSDEENSSFFEVYADQWHSASVGKTCNVEKTILFPPSAVEPVATYGAEKAISFLPSVVDTEAFLWHRANKGKTCSAEKASMFPPSSDEPMAIDGHRANNGKTCNAVKAIRFHQTILKSDQIGCSQHYTDDAHEAHTNALKPVVIHDETEPRSWLVRGNDWDIKAPLSVNARYELSYWLANLVNLNGRTLHSFNLIDAVCYSDASATGYGGYLTTKLASPVQGLWNPTESKMSSTWRELVALFRTMHGLQSDLNDKHVKWFVDNKGAASILRVGSRKRVLHSVALQISQICREINCTLDAQWIPRDQNRLADELSKNHPISDRDDWGLYWHQFAHIDAQWGPHDVDRFASAVSTKCARYNSKLPDLGSEAVDAFTQNWQYDNNWLCPPVGLIAKVLQHCRRQHVRGTLIVPFWPSAYFWPLLKPNGTHFAWFVKSYERFYGLYKSNELDTCAFNSAPTFDTLALKVQF